MYSFNDDAEYFVFSGAGIIGRIDGGDCKYCWRCEEICDNWCCCGIFSEDIVLVTLKSLI